MVTRLDEQSVIGIPGEMVHQMDGCLGCPLDCV